MPSCPPKTQNIFDTSRKLLKNKNYSFPILRYFTRKLAFVSYILSMIVIFCFYLKLYHEFSKNYFFQSLISTSWLKPAAFLANLNFWIAFLWFSNSKLTFFSCFHFWLKVDISSNPWSFNSNAIIVTKSFILKNNNRLLKDPIL